MHTLLNMALGLFPFAHSLRLPQKTRAGFPPPFCPQAKPLLKKTGEGSYSSPLFPKSRGWEQEVFSNGIHSVPSLLGTAKLCRVG